MTTQSEATLKKCLIDKLVEGGYEKVQKRDEIDTLISKDNSLICSIRMKNFQLSDLS